MTYYNEIDRTAAAWLRALIAEGHIAHGEVDERSIKEVTPDDLRGYTQCHFFAGIGVWSYALRLAGWADDSAVWTGSCPCQPFSVAGKRGGADDERHLWPEWFRLIAQCRPPVCFGEQVASPDGLQWLDLVSADLEGAGYAVGAADLCAAGVGAPHIRQRLYFVADALPAGRTPRRSEPWLGPPSRSGGAGGLAHTELPERRAQHRARDGVEGQHALPQRQEGAGGLASRGTACNMAHAERERIRGAESGAPGAEARGMQGEDGQRERLRLGPGPSRSPLVRMGDAGSSGLARRSRQSRDDGAEQPAPERAGGPVGGFWADAEWIYCTDGKYRPVEPGSFPLAPRTAGHVGRLRGYGNTLVAPVAAEFIAAYLDVRAPG